MSDDDKFTTKKTARHSVDRKIVVGWREWIALPQLCTGQIKAKLDTGAHTSTLHAWNIEPTLIDKIPHVRFCTHSFEKGGKHAVECVMERNDRRWVKNSSGDADNREVILTLLTVANQSWPIEVTLTNRADMGFRFLLGREAMRGRLIVDPSRSYIMGRDKSRKSPS